MSMFRILTIVLTGLALAPTPALADEVFVGVAAHGVDTPFTLQTGEGGVDVEGGWRGDKIQELKFLGKPEPYAFISINDRGDTSLAAVGLSWTLGKTVYVRPGIGLAIHDGPSYRVNDEGTRTDLGSRILFEPEIALGVRVSKKVSVEASWVHVSHARLFNSKQNPGLDIIGGRVNIKL